jgi:hypothetical protein
MYCPNILNLLQTGFSFFLIWVVKKWKLKRVSFLCLLKLLSIQTAIRTTITVLAHTLRVLPFFCNAGWLAGWPAGWLAVWLAGWLAGWMDGWMAGWLALALRQDFSGGESAGNWGYFLPHPIFIA